MHEIRQKKVLGGGNGGAAEVRISSLTLVISLESKLINKIKAMLFWFVWASFLASLVMNYDVWFGLDQLAWFGLVWFCLKKF